MSRQRVPLEREALVSILDATLVQCDGSDAPLLRTFDAARRNGACRAFAAFTPAERPSAAALAALPALPEDERAAEIFAELCGDRVRMVDARAISRYGGSLHCISWNS